MVYRPEIDERLCFVLMPFRQPFNDYYEKIIKAAAAGAGLEALRADDIFGNGIIITDIWDHIWHARVVIADVTDKNANVNYELGLCHALGVPTVLITRRIEDVPFDYRHRRCITYDTNEVAWDQKLKNDLTKTLQVALTSDEIDEDLKWPYDTQKAETGSSYSLISTENPRDLFVQGTSNAVMRI